MPLPFLADNAGHDKPDAHGGHAEGPWTRPYRPGPYRVAGAAMLLVLASYLLFGALIDAAAGSASGAGALLVAALLVITGALRSLHMGIWVSGRGLRRTGLFRTVTVEWQQVGRVHTAQQPVRWLALPRTVQGQALVIERTDGSELPTLLTDHNADFLGRAESFDIAADAIESWADVFGQRR
ncbi:MAG: hypothetical protein JO362_12165 [Streptomycetaceae bacterium]|nr:hypothetical protein [Streptomycetaceae bacterium]